MQSMRIACHAWAYNNLSLEDAVGTIARLGFRYVDLGSGPQLDVGRAAAYPEAEAANIVRLLERFELNITDLYLMLPYTNSPDPSQREAQLNLFERLIPFAVALGTPGITISAGIVHKDGLDHSLARSVPGQPIADFGIPPISPIPFAAEYSYLPESKGHHQHSQPHQASAEHVPGAADMPASEPPCCPAKPHLQA